MDTALSLHAHVKVCFNTDVFYLYRHVNTENDSVNPVPLTALGTPPLAPAVTKPVGYPLAGFSHAYEGLCAYTCARDYCPPTACSYTQAPLVDPTTSPFLPPTCIGGQGPSPFEGSAVIAAIGGFTLGMFVPVHRKVD